MPPAAKAVKRTGKENAPPSRTIKASKTVPDFEEDFDEEGQSISGFSVDDGPVKSKASSSKSVTKSSSQLAKSTKPKSRTVDEDDDDMDGEQDDDDDNNKRGSGELQRKLSAMTAERDRIRIQRDAFSKQFEELSKTRSTSIESIFEKYKEKAGVQAKAQNDIIASLTELNEKLQARTLSLEKSLTEVNAATKLAASEPPPKADPKEIKKLKDELAQTQTILKNKEERLSSLEKEYKFEMEQHRKLQSSTRGTQAPAAAAAVSTTPEEAEKDAVSLKLYEDLTDLNIMNVKIIQGKNGKEITFNCVQTVAGRSLNFKLRSFNDLSPELLASKADNPWVKTLLYTPEGLAYETDKEWVNKLGVFGKSFSAPREQVAGFWDGLKLALNGEE